MKETADLTLYKSIFDHAGEGIWVLDQQLNTLFINQAFKRIFIHSIKLDSNFSAFNLLPKSKNKQFYETIFENGKAENTPLVFLCKTAFEVELQITTHFVRFDKKTIIYVQRHISTSELENSRRIKDYLSLFEDSPIPIWDEDFSKVKSTLNQLQQQGICNFRKHFAENPQLVWDLADKIIINNINRAVIDLNEAQNKEEVLSKLASLQTEHTFDYFVRQFVAIAENRSTCEFDAILKTTKGNFRQVIFKWVVARGHETDYSRIFLTTTDYTKQIVQDNLALQQSNREKEILIKEIHHRVKNNFQIITSLIRLQNNSISNEELNAVLTVLLNRVFSMSSVHEILYQADNFETINLKDYLSQLVHLLIESLEVTCKIESEIIVDEISLSLEQASPFGLIINELITNSIKHGFDGFIHGKIYIHASKIDSYIKILIGDNGNGIQTKPATESSLGLTMVESLVNQLNGTLNLIPNNVGTHYELIF